MKKDFSISICSLKSCFQQKLCLVHLICLSLEKYIYVLLYIHSLFFLDLKAMQCKCNVFVKLFQCNSIRGEALIHLISIHIFNDDLFSAVFQLFYYLKQIKQL